jgi:uncharacterized protein
MLREQIYDEVKAAMKAREGERLETLRFVWSEIKNVEIDAKHELSDEEVIALLRREVKKRKEALEQYRGAGRHDLVEQEEKQLKIIEVYVPQMMNEEEVRRVIDEEVGEEKDFGRAMGKVMGKLKGKADGAIVQRLVRERLPV